MSKMKFLDPLEAEKFKNQSVNSFAGHPVDQYPRHGLVIIRNKVQLSISCQLELSLAKSFIH